MRPLNVMIGIVWVLLICGCASASCPLDHLLIGCNRDGVAGTDDDMKLFVDCVHKYRHSDPNHSGDPTWLNWHYPLYYSERYDRYQIGEPGFEVITDDPDLRLSGTADVDYRIMIECVSITSGFAVRNSSLGVTFDEPGDSFNHSSLLDPHLHLQYRAPSPAGGTDLHWITYRLYDEIADANQYEPSEAITVVFAAEPAAGDLDVDGIVDAYDFAMLGRYWLLGDGSISNDYYERADANRDGFVDLPDRALLASHWLCSAGSQGDPLTGFSEYSRRRD